MVADTQIKHTASFYRRTRQGSMIPLIKGLDYSLLDDTDPAKSVYLNGGAPDGSGFTRETARVALQAGEKLIYVAQNRNGANVVIDSTGSASGKLLISLWKVDNNTEAGFPDSITEANRDTSYLADDGTLVNGKESEAYAFTVPDGETWQLYGLLQADLRTAS